MSKQTQPGREKERKQRAELDRSNREAARVRARTSIFKKTGSTVESQRVEWKREAEAYIKKRFKFGRRIELTQWGPEGFRLRDHAAEQSAVVTWAQAYRLDYPEWFKKPSKQSGSAGIISSGNQTPPAKKKPGRNSKRKKKKRNKKGAKK